MNKFSQAILYDSFICKVFILPIIWFSSHFNVMFYKICFFFMMWFYTIYKFSCDFCTRTIYFHVFTIHTILLDFTSNTLISGDFFLFFSHVIFIRFFYFFLHNSQNIWFFWHNLFISMWFDMTCFFYTILIILDYFNTIYFISTFILTPDSSIWLV